MRFLRVAGVLAGIAAAIPGCARAPRPVLAGEIPLEARVLIVAPELGRSWHPGRLIQSDEGCLVVTVATTREQTPVVVVNLGQIVRLQRSQAMPPPDWWAEPAEGEEWTELDLTRLRNESERCRRRYPPDGRR